MAEKIRGWIRVNKLRPGMLVTHGGDEEHDLSARQAREVTMERRKRRNYTVAEEGKALDALLLLTQGMLDHAGECRCRLCEAYLKLSEFGWMKLETLNQREPDAVLE